MRRTFILAGLLLLVLVVPSHSANPGGMGDSSRDFSCGGSCHGDPGLSQSSSAEFQFELDRTSAYVGGPISITVSATGMELSPRGLVGLFLLADTHGVADTPEDAGWTILSDGAGGSGNYVENHAFDSTTGVSVTWSLIAPPSEGVYTLYAEADHGGDGSPRMNLSQAFTIDVGPIPENLPQMIDWEPMTSRGLGETSTMTLPVVNATSVHLEYRIGEGQVTSVAVRLENNVWTAELPAALSDIVVHYRIVMTNDEFSETTGWITVGMDEDGYSADLTSVRLQALALMLTSLALCITIQRRMARPAHSKDEPPAALISVDQTDILAASFAPTTLSMDDPRRPFGWSDEQWEHYGPTHIVEHHGGGL